MPNPSSEWSRLPDEGEKPADIAPLLRIGLDDAVDADATILVTAPTPRTGSSTAGGARGWQPPTLEELQHMLPQYEISAFIALGGMGAVYKGAQKTLKRPVAIKVLPPDLEDGDLQFAARFKHEAQAMAQLSHPNIVAVFDAGEVELGRADGSPSAADGGLGTARPTLLYFVMEFIEGTDVAQLIASEGIIEPRRAIQITTAVCEALAFAHEEGIIHRDIKPSNIMIDKRGRVKVADFGLAKAVNLESTLMTRSDVAMGTPDFVAPEALIPGMKVDGRADLYAVGVMLYQMLTGKIPRGRFELPSGVIPQVDKGFDAIVDRAMQTDRDKRYSTATEMKRDVERVGTTPHPNPLPASGARGPEAAAQPSSPSPQRGEGRGEGRKDAKSRKPLLLGTAAAAAVIVLGAGAFFLTRPATPEQAERTTAAADSSPASAESRAIQLWDAPDKLPNQNGVSWVDGAITLKSTSLREPIMPRDVMFRSAIQIGPDAEHSQIHVRSQFHRDQSDPLRSTWYALGMRSDHKTLGLIKWVSGQSSLVKSWPLPKTYQTGDWLTMELKAKGNLFTVAVDGHLLGTASDSSLMEPGGLVIASQKEGRFRDVEYINLDGLSEAEALNAAGIDPAPLSPSPQVSNSPAFPPGQWVKVAGTLNDLPERVRDRFSMSANGRWFVPQGMQGLTWPTLQGRNCGIRGVFRREGAHFTRLELRRDTERASSESYTFGLVDPKGVTQVAHFRQQKFADDKSSRSLSSHHLPAPPPDGEEYTLEFYAIGTMLIGKLNGQVKHPVQDSSLQQGFLGLMSWEAFRDVEVINLDGLSEAEALKAAGIDPVSLSPSLPVPASNASRSDAGGSKSSAAPLPQPGPDGRMVFPAGVWTQMRDLTKQQKTEDGPWVRLGEPAYGWFEKDIVPMTNLGIRARFRGQRVKDYDYPQLNLRGVENTALNLHIRSGKMHIRVTEEGFPVLAEAPLREPLPQGKEYVAELYAIGRQVIARVNGQVLTASTDVPPAPGSFDLFGADRDYFQDAQVLNLDGLSEAEARKAAGIGE